MIDEFVEIFIKNEDKLKHILSQKHPENYLELLKIIINIIYEDYNLNDEYRLDPSRIVEIDQGDYQGMLLFIIGCAGYQPDYYYYTSVYYGSCSGCDTLEGIRGYEDEIPNETQIKDYLTLILHMVQKIKKMEL